MGPKKKVECVMSENEKKLQEKASTGILKFISYN